jgi:hypothetical protein
MDYETVSADNLGRSLTGLGVNLLSPDVRALAGFLADVFGLSVHRLSDDFAIVLHRDTMFQLHADGTYHSNPLLGLVPEMPPRGARGAVLPLRDRPGWRRERGQRRRATW